MNKLIELLKYHFDIYTKSNKFIMPLVAWLAFMFVSYSIIPVGVVPSCLVSMVCLFFIMVWVSISYTELVEPVSEQIVLLKVRNDNLYYFSKLLFLIILGLIFSILGILFPSVQNVINGFKLYIRPITFYDIIAAFILYFVTSSLGAVTGMLLQPRIIKDRKIAVVSTFMIALMGLANGFLNSNVPFTRYITWVFPPLSNMIACFSGKKYFYLNDIITAVFYACMYSTIVYFINVYFLKKNKF